MKRKLNRQILGKLATRFLTCVCRYPESKQRTCQPLAQRLDELWRRLLLQCRAFGLERHHELPTSSWSSPSSTRTVLLLCIRCKDGDGSFAGNFQVSPTSDHRPWLRQIATINSSKENFSHCNTVCHYHGERVTFPQRPPFLVRATWNRWVLRVTSGLQAKQTLQREIWRDDVWFAGQRLLARVFKAIQTDVLLTGVTG